jgi:polyferredoxin/Pyruvate/2-oxoacid:ferredoxin oxidoreductase delta subunit
MSEARDSLARASARWITLRRMVQYLAFGAFIAAVIGSGRAGWADAFATQLIRLDPLTSLASAIAGRTLFQGAALALILAALTLAFGRVWCGWLCPLGTALDLAKLSKRRPSGPSPPDTWRSGKYALLLLILFGALFADLTLLVLDPLTLMTRTINAALLPAMDVGVTALEFALYRIPFLRAGVGEMDALLRPALLPQNPVVSRAALALGVLSMTVIALNILAERFWCRYVCPLGGLLGLLSKLSLVQRQVGSGCSGCRLCARACPTGTIDPEHNFESDPGECTLCLECLPACPKEDVEFPLRLHAPRWASYDPTRRGVLLSLGGAVLGVGLLRSSDLGAKAHPYWLLPPGAEKAEFLDKCIRCGACLGACPTGGLQPAVREAGLGGFWSPVLVPRSGYCHYTCNACGQACPVAAISPLELEDKQAAIIGRAVIDRDRCLPWSQGTDCIVCEEMCPLPQKAIVLESEPDGTSVEGSRNLLLPRVIAEDCIGCGICEYKCPLDGPAAVRVFSKNTA